MGPDRCFLVPAQLHGGTGTRYSKGPVPAAQWTYNFWTRTDSTILCTATYRPSGRLNGTAVLVHVRNMRYVVGRNQQAAARQLY